MFEYQLQLIRELGFGGWLAKYPVNPVTMIAGMVVIGIIVLIINAKVRKRKALTDKPADAAIVVLQKRNTGNNTWAENVRVDAVNGAPVHWFFHKTVAAIYLSPGPNELTVHAEYARREGGAIKMYRQVNPARLTVDVAANRIYALHYRIADGKYLLTEGDRFEDNAFDREAE